MAQEFKLFDKKFAKEKRTHAFLRRLSDAEGISRMAHLKRRGGWPFAFRIWDQAFVQECVYKLEDHEDWQLFRYSLKGLTTYQKLTMLWIYGISHTLPDGSGCDVVAQCRIDNYIGALKRGGQLGSKLEVLK